MIHYVRIFLGFVLVSLVMACGGGGGSPGATTTGNSSNAAGTATLTVSDFALFTDKTTVNNGGADKALLTVVAVDASRNVVPGATVKVSVDQNAVFTPVAGLVTDATGSYTGNLTIGSDKTDRSVTVAVTINGITKQVAVRIVGTKLTLQATPSVPSPNQAVTVAATLVDFSNNPIPNALVTLGGNVPGVPSQALLTGLDGQVTRVFTAPAAAGAYTLTASGGGVFAADYQLLVFTSVVPAAVIPAGAVPSLAAAPNVLAVNSAGSTTNRATLRFLFLDGTNKPIPNVRVRFVDQTVGLAAVGSSITSGTQTLYTDAAGSVSSQFIAGQNTSPTNGVVVRACYSANDFATTTDCPNFVNTSLTIAGQALSVSIGDDNLLVKGPGTYIKQFAVTVADSAGRAVANAPVDISVDLTHYGKGNYFYFVGTTTFTTFYTDGSGASINPLLAVPSSLTASYPSASTVPGTPPVARVWCANEDLNRNGNVDAGENVNNSVDSNGQPTLEPRKSDLIVSYVDPNVTSTNASGILLVKVEYSQRFATWLAYKIRVTANVAGSQGLNERLFVTKAVEGDDLNGSFLTPPYGSGSCVSPN